MNFRSLTVSNGKWKLKYNITRTNDGWTGFTIPWDLIDGYGIHLKLNK